MRHNTEDVAVASAVTEQMARALLLSRVPLRDADVCEHALVQQPFTMREIVRHGAAARQTAREMEGTNAHR